MKVKKFILENISRLPNWLLFVLMKLNTRPKLIFGGQYFTRYQELRSGKLDSFNEKALFTFVNKAINEVPYYSECLNGVKINSLEDFVSKIPLIDKDIVLENFENFINPKLDLSKYDHGTTGGTSGKPLKLIMPPERYIVELATMHYLWSTAGYDFDVRAVIRNHKLIDNETFTINPLTKEVIFDGFRLNNEYFETIYTILKKQNIKFVHCYPSTAYTFAKFLVETQKDTSFLKAFLCGSENVVDYQKKFIEDNLPISFFSFYGHSEKLVLGGYINSTQKKNEKQGYFFEPSYGYYELLDKNGNVINEPDILGEIVGTSLNNPGMPLIRYRTGDYASYKTMDGLADGYGRNMPVIGAIQGRWGGEKIYNLDGSFVSTTAMNLHSDLYERINGIQYIQKKMGQIEILIIKGNNYKEEDEQTLYHHFEAKLNSDMNIVITYVDKLIRKPNGKFLQLLSDV